MKTIRLYGPLSRRFGREFHLAVRTPAEAVHALCKVIPGFQAALATNDKYTIFVNHDDKSVLDYANPLGEDDIVRIVPIVSGAGDGLKVLLGVALVFVAPTIGWALASNFAITTTTLTSIISGISGLGWSLILGGVSGLLFGPPETPSYESADNLPSYVFDGPVNTIRQGNAVPVGYGRLRVGSQVVSSGITSVRINLEGNE